MARIIKYGKPRSSRFLKPIDEKLEAFCKENVLNPSDVIQKAVECFMTHSSCKARKGIVTRK